MTTATAILSALKEEQQGLLELLQNPERVTRAGRDFWCGQLHGQPVVLALSRVGKVAAATTATTLIEHFGTGRIVFTGVAGGIGPGIDVGDVVIASSFVQHDMDASPLFPRYEVPLYGRSVFGCDAAFNALLNTAANSISASGAGGVGSAVPQSFKLHHGLIASGDRFVCGVAETAACLTPCTARGFNPLRSKWKARRWLKSALTTACRSPPCASFQTAPMIQRTLTSRSLSPKWPTATRLQSSTGS